jgi:TDG/mug DNA glycosylase family protein
VILDEVLQPGLKIVFCGTQAGRVSAERRAYYAGPGNRFWPTLHAVGLTPVLLKPEEYGRLLEFGIGVTDVAEETCGPDSALIADHFDVPGFWRRIGEAAPLSVAFNGKRAAAAALRTRTVILSYGPQPARDGRRIFVLPSTSGAASGFWSLEPWRDLARAADSF